MIREALTDCYSNANHPSRLHTIISQPIYVYSVSHISFREPAESGRFLGRCRPPLRSSSLPTTRRHSFTSYSSADHHLHVGGPDLLDYYKRPFYVPVEVRCSTTSAVSGLPPTRRSVLDSERSTRGSSGAICLEPDLEHHFLWPRPARSGQRALSYLMTVKRWSAQGLRASQTGSKIKVALASIRSRCESHTNARVTPF